MENERIFRIVTGILFAVFIVTRKIYETQAMMTRVEKDFDDKRVIVLTGLFLTVSLSGLVAYLIQPNLMNWSTIKMPEWMRWVGAAAGAAGTGLLVWSHAILGLNFFGGTKIREGHCLVTGGPYKWVRHPIYTAFTGIGIGWFLIMQNWFVGGTWLATMVIFLPGRLKKEEEMLSEHFGEEYERYRKRTGKFLPKF